jgi:hypothetical protein
MRAFVSLGGLIAIAPLLAGEEPPRGLAPQAVSAVEISPAGADIVFTGYGVRRQGVEFLTELIEHTEKSLASPGQ